jgi:D-sedoheptulose 7-phosphate isomerase
MAPSEDTAVIQQIHVAFAHGICEVIEQALMQGKRA